MAKDFYEVLGVSKKATDDEIKKAYRKLARENHPDRNPDDPAAEERFKEIQEANSTLSDSEKREAYDAGPSMFSGFGGTGGPAPGGFGRSENISDIFSGLFNRGGGRATEQQRGSDLETEIALSFNQAIHGDQITVTVPKSERCQTCRGTGAEAGTSPVVCPRCGGRGIDSQSQGFFSMSHPCPQCGGSGQVIENPCQTCGGSGLTRQTKRYKVNIPAGVQNGTRIRLAGKGEAGPRGGPPGDLFVTTRVAESPVFKQLPDGNLEVAVPITFVEATRGATVEVPILGGTKKIRIAPGTEHGAIQRLRGEGPPRPNSRGAKGDIRYRLAIDVPKKLSKDQKSALDEFAGKFNHNPREELLKRASAGSGKVNN